ncbi:MAG TPA: glycosyltransferase [Roseiflexaceae bacterium]|nr:glycosyltransferase [Roseiflexaceae bacterium]
MERKKPSILFAISDTGGGHRSGAVAIKAALELLVGDEVECHIVDMLATTGTPILKNAPELYDVLSTRLLPFYDLLYRATDGTRRITVLSQLVYLQAHRNIVRVMEETRPNLVVSVHPLSNRLIGNARSAYKLSFRFVCVVTDLVSLHAAWADPEVELCMVPTQEAYERQQLRHLPPAKLARTGFPVHPKFAAYTGDGRSARAELGLREDLFSILVTSGGVGSGNVRPIVQELRRAFPQHQIMVIAGKNKALREELEGLGLGPDTHIYGFVNNMEVLMAASDIIVTKAGPGTLMEALVMRRPVIVTEAVGMQEQGNIDFVLNHELGAFCPTIDRLEPAISELMQPDVYAATVARLQDAVPRDGSIQIARILLEQLHMAPPVRRRLRLPRISELPGLRRLGTEGSPLRLRLKRPTLRLPGLRLPKLLRLRRNRK